MCVPVAVTAGGVISAGGATLISQLVALGALGAVLIVTFRGKIKALLR
ncbi:MAG: hypothetical protein J7K81_03945 [Methanophagales archaeon]|nr:hypothetical protein [Methanophagales archaeon]